VTIRPSASGDYSVRAEALGVFSIESVQYADPTDVGRMGHEVHMLYETLPPAKDTFMTATLSTNAPANPAVYTWEAIADDGSLLGTLPLTRRTAETFDGTVAVASISANGTRSWRVRVRGTDASGQPFARVLPPLQTARVVSMNSGLPPPYWLAGATHKVPVKLTHHGQDGGIYQVTATTSAGTVVVAQGLSPALKANESHLSELALSIPANLAANETHTLSIEVRSQGGSGPVVATAQVRFRVEADADGDGVPNSIEAGVGGVAHPADGNTDGVADYLQGNVIGLSSYNGRARMTAVLSAGSFTQARPLPREDLAEGGYGLDLLEFRIVGLTPGASTQMTILLPQHLGVTGYTKYGPEPGNPSPHWYDFAYQDGSQLGAKMQANNITLHFQDGARGDDDLTANGTIVDAGGPTGLHVRGTVAETPAGASSGGNARTSA
jgi:hypothetical protein